VENISFSQKVLLKGSYGVSLDVATLAIICDVVVDGDVYNTLFEVILGIVAEERTYLSIEVLNILDPGIK
jgi:hypothetical protein